MDLPLLTVAPQTVQSTLVESGPTSTVARKKSQTTSQHYPMFRTLHSKLFVTMHGKFTTGTNASKRYETDYK